VTTHIGVPAEFYGAKVIGSWSLPCPWYKPLPLSLALSPRIYKEVADFRPDIIHASSPGLMVMSFPKVQYPLCIFLIFSSTYPVGPLTIEDRYRSQFSGTGFT
jgi:sulfoquinovosyltransferase